MRFKLFLLCAAVLGLSSCGGGDLDRPISIAVRQFPADTDFRLSFTMTTCSDRCNVYESDDCTADVNTEDRVISASPSASVASTLDGDVCEAAANQCGASVVAFCEVEGIPAGEYTVEAGDFTGNIVIQ